MSKRTPKDHAAFTPPQTVDDVVRELDKVPLGQALCVPIHRGETRIRQSRIPKLVGSMAFFEPTTKAIFTSTASPMIIAHELRHFAQYAYQAPSTPLSHMSTIDQFRMVHVLEADAYAYASMTCLQLAWHYLQKQNLPACEYYVEQAHMMGDTHSTQSISNPYRVGHDVKNINAIGARLFNDYASKRSLGWTIIRKSYTSKAMFYASKPKHELYLATLLSGFIAPSQCFSAVKMMLSMNIPAALFSSGITIIAIALGIGIARNYRDTAHAALMPESPDRIRDILTTYGQMPDGTNYLMPNGAQSDLPKLVPPTWALEKKINDFTKHVEKSRLFKAWDMAFRAVPKFNRASKNTRPDNKMNHTP